MDLRGDRTRHRGDLGQRLVDRGDPRLDRGGAGGDRGLLDVTDQLVVDTLLGGEVRDQRARGDRPLTARRGERGDPGDRAAIARLGGGGGDPRGEPAGLVAEPVGEDLAVDHPQPGGVARGLAERGDRGAERLARGVVVLGLGGEPDDLILDQSVARGERERLGEIGERPGGVVVVLEPDRGGLAQEREPGPRVVGGLGEPGGQQIEHTGPVAVAAERIGERVGGAAAGRRGLEQGGQAGARGRVLRIDRERVAIGDQRAIGRTEVLAQGIAEPAEPAHGALGVAGRRPLEQLRHLAPAVGLREQIGERGHALGVLAALARDPLPGRDRAVEIAAVLAVDRRDPGQVRALLRRGHVLARAQLERGDQLVPPLVRLEQRDPGVERGEVVRIAVDPALPQRERAIVIAERLREPRGLADDGEPVRLALLEIRHALEHVEPLALAIDPRVQLAEPATDQQLLALPRALLRERLLVQVDRPRRVVEQIELGARRFGEQLDPAGHALRGPAGGRDTLGVPGVVVRALRELAQLLLRHAGLGLEREQRGVVIHRGLVVVELGEPGAGLLAQPAAAGGIELDHPLEHADHLARLAGGVVVRAQQIERGLAHGAGRVGGLDHALEQLARLLVAGRLGEQRLDRGERPRGVAEVVEPGRRDPGAGLLALGLGLALELALPQRDQIGPALVALEQALEPLRELDVVGGERQEALEVADRAIGQLRDVLRELRRLAQHPDPARLVLGRVERAVIEPEHVGPALVLRVDHAEPLDRGVGVRGQLEDPGQDPLDHLGLVAEPGVAERAGALAEHLGDVAGDVAAEDIAIGGDHVVRSIGLGGEVLQLVPRADRVRSFLDGMEGFLERGRFGHGSPERGGPARTAPAPAVGRHRIKGSGARSARGRRSRRTAAPAGRWPGRRSAVGRPVSQRSS
jgi:hypothetical protein